MNMPTILRRLAVAAVIVGLWSYEAHLWYARKQIVFRHDPQSFWEKVSFPSGVDAAEPILSTMEGPLGEAETDRYSQELLRAAKDPASSRLVVKCDISALDKLCQERESWLRQYLACNPGWSFFTRHRSPIAERRVRKGDQWHRQEWRAMIVGESCGSGGDEFDLEAFDTVGSNCSIYFGGLDFNWERCRSGGQVRLPLRPDDDDDFNDIEVVCDGEKLSLDVTEMTTFVTSRVVQVAFDLTRDEFAAVQCATNWAQLKAVLPEGSVRKGPASLDVLCRLASDGKILNYAYQAWVNPGEPGETYLRLFEVSQGVELGIGIDGDPTHVKEETMEFAGWSDEPDEKFFIGSDMPLHAKRKDFAMRVEVWFIPANGGPERKLVERVFKVKGGGR